MISWMRLNSEMKAIRGEFFNSDFRCCYYHTLRVGHWPGAAEAPIHTKLIYLKTCVEGLGRQCLTCIHEYLSLSQSPH